MNSRVHEAANCGQNRRILYDVLVFVTYFFSHGKAFFESVICRVIDSRLDLLWDFQTKRN